MVRTAILQLAEVIQTSLTATLSEQREYVEGLIKVYSDNWVWFSSQLLEIATCQDFSEQVRISACIQLKNLLKKYQKDGDQEELH